MNEQHDLDRLLDAALLDGPSRAPERPIDAALAHARAHPRRRDPLAIIRKDPMNARSSWLAVALQPLPLVAVLALVLVAGLAVATAGGFIDHRSVVVPPAATPSPAASPIPSAPASPSPAPSVVPSAPASPAIISVDLIEHTGANATIDITDLSGHLVKAESGDPGFNASVPDGTVAVTGLAANPATVVLTWGGSPCDTTHQLTIDPDGLSMTIERPVCQGDALAVDHVLQLTFDRPVDPATVHATIRTIGS
jgi:hypothetical protein